MNDVHRASNSKDLLDSGIFKLVEDIISASLDAQSMLEFILPVLKATSSGVKLLACSVDITY